jgi:hypothetical protein
MEKKSGTKKSPSIFKGRFTVTVEEALNEALECAKTVHNYKKLDMPIVKGRNWPELDGKFESALQKIWILE